VDAKEHAARTANKYDLERARAHTPDIIPAIRVVVEARHADVGLSPFRLGQHGELGAVLIVRNLKRFH